MSFNVLVTARTISQEGIDVLENAGMNLLFLRKEDQISELHEILSSQPVDAILSRTVNLSSKILKLNPSLKIIARHGVGIDNVDINAATQLGIPVVITPGTNAQSVAELAFALLLACARNLVNSTHEIRQKLWNRQSHGVELSGKTLGLIGFGRIAQDVSNIARSFGMKVVAYDPYTQSSDVVLSSSLESLLRQSDVVSLHCPAQDDTVPLLGQTEFSMFKPGAILINTARGSLVDEFALAESLRTGHIRAAGLDTLAIEPPTDDNPLLKQSNIVFSPHIGGNTDRSLIQTATLAAQQIVDYLTLDLLDENCLVNPHFKVH